MSNILIIGATTKSGMYTIKQLKKYGLAVIVYDWTNSPVKNSKYVNEYISVKPPFRKVSIFVDGLLEFIKKNKIECVLPINDPALEICKTYFEQLSAYAKVIGVNDSPAHEYAHNKYELIKAAATVGIKYPKSILITSLSEVESRKSDFNFPCIVKPASSAIIKDDRLYVFSVKRLESLSELVDYMRENISSVPVIVQEIINGYGIGYNIIAKEGKVLNEYIHKRIYESGGESSYRESLSVNEYGLREKIHRLIDFIKWNGVAMIEFKIDGDEAYIMEMNGRFWGSIEVAIRSGLNYPVMLYELQYLNKDIKIDLPVKYVRVRNLQEELVVHFTSLLKNRDWGSFFNWISTFKTIYKSNEVIEDNFFDDPKFVISCYYSFFKKFIEKRKVKRQINSINLSEHQIALSKQEGLTIAFVCAGNICRSPFAEHYARKTSPQNKYFSFGTVNMQDRLSPVNAVDAAQQYGIDLASHKSLAFDLDAASKADYIFVMDKSNYYEIRKLFPMMDKVFFLGQAEIADPYGQSLNDFLANYQLIVGNVNRLLQGSR